MSTLCVVIGPPGSGKTRCSRQLGNALTLSVVSTDDLRAEVGTPASDRGSEAAVYSRLTDRVIQTLNQGKGVVADATFYLRSYRDVLRSRATELGHEVLLIQVVTPLDLCRWRVGMRQRKREGGYGGITSTAVFDDVLRATQGIDEAEAALYADGVEMDSSVEPIRLCRRWGPRATALFEQWKGRKTMSRNDRGVAQLRRLFRAHQAPVAFVGSGLSTNYPSWFQFVLRIAKKTNHAAAGLLEAAERMGSGADPSVASIKDNIEALTAIADECLAVERNNRADYAPADLVREVFSSPRTARPRVFDSLVRAPFQFFITTNYDQNIEDAFKEVTGRDLPVVTAMRPGRVIELVHAGQPFVFKVHGCVKFDGPFVIGADDYTRMIRETSDVRMLLRSIFATHSIVFFPWLRTSRSPHHRLPARCENSDARRRRHARHFRQECSLGVRRADTLCTTVRCADGTLDRVARSGADIR